jgi:hypothetical protein
MHPDDVFLLWELIGVERTWLRVASDRWTCVFYRSLTALARDLTVGIW